MQTTSPLRPDQRPTHADGRLAAPGSSETPHRIICAPCTPRRAAGFTLIELMVATAVSAVLSSLAYPSFQAQVQKSRRADATLAIHQVQMAQERWRANHTGYATLAQLGLGATSPSGHYRLAMDAVALHGYEVAAHATGVQSRDADCGSISLRVDGANVAYRSATQAATPNPPAQNRVCWSL